MLFHENKNLVNQILKNAKCKNLNEEKRYHIVNKGSATFVRGSYKLPNQLSIMTRLNLNFKLDVSELGGKSPKGSRRWPTWRKSVLKRKKEERIEIDKTFTSV